MLAPQSMDEVQPVIDALVTHYQAERLKGEGGMVM